MINSDSSVNVDERVQEYVTDTTHNALARFETNITTLKVHLSDEANKKSHRIFKCNLEARLEHMKPTAVSAESDNLDAAIDDALVKLTHHLDRALGKIKSH
ncbi:HPF/RaiA family ribosome-associated protein [bacterium]|nr:HPF/RaiA family ribosome-associated protein [bacterium]